LKADIEKKFLSIVRVLARGQCRAASAAAPRGALKQVISKTILAATCISRLSIFIAEIVPKAVLLKRSVRQHKDRVIGDIEDLPSKLGCDPRAHGNRLHQRHVEVYDTGGLLDLKDDPKYLFIGLLSPWITATAVVDIRNDNRFLLTANLPWEVPQRNNRNRQVA